MKMVQYYSAIWSTLPMICAALESDSEMIFPHLLIKPINHAQNSLNAVLKGHSIWEVSTCNESINPIASITFPLLLLFYTYHAAVDGENVQHSLKIG